jgi:hypothetical protein
MIAVAFDNCGEIIQEYSRCVRWLLSRCIYFDTGNGAWRDQVNIHATREDPKFAAFLVSHVRWFCTLAEQKLICCNPRVHGSARRRRDVDAGETSAGDSMLFPLVARVCPTSALGRSGQLSRVLPQVFLEIPDGAFYSVVSMAARWKQLISDIIDGEEILQSGLCLVVESLELWFETLD